MPDLCVLADVKAYLGLTSSADDAVLSSIISAESAFIQGMLNRQLAVLPYTDQFCGGGKTGHKLYQSPCGTVTSVTVNGCAIPATTSSMAAGYMVIKDNVVLFGYTFSRGNYNCVITYTAGITCPPDVAHACLELVALKYKEKDRVGLASKGLAGETTSYVTSAMPEHVKAILKNYRRIVPS